jgi:hypothetical protein
MRTFPIGTKIKQFMNNTNISAQLQTNIEKEINTFYKRIPLKEETFDGKLNKTKIDKNKSDKYDKSKNKPKNKTKKLKNSKN